MVVLLGPRYKIRRAIRGGRCIGRKEGIAEEAYGPGEGGFTES